MPDDLVAAEAVEAPGQALAACLRPLAARLPPIYRDTLVAAEILGQPLQVIADREGVTLGAVKTRAHRGRQLLREELLACCEVLLSEQGEVLDFATRGEPRCGTVCSCIDSSREAQ